MTGLGNRWLVVCVLGASVSLWACSPTYRKEQLLQAIKRICEREHHLSVSTRQVGQTIAVHLDHEGILAKTGDQIVLSSTANEVFSDVLQAIHRAVLSSDAAINFYALLVSDPTVPGAYLTLIRHVEDVRRANVNILSPTEFLSRTVLELNYVGVPGLGLEQLILNDIQLEQFLSWQLAKRIQTRLIETLQDYKASSVEVGRCVGQFQAGEFAFTLNVTAKSPEVIDEGLVKRIFEEATGLIAKVLSNYRFKNFDSIRLLHPSTGRSLLLPKTQLELFR